MEEKTYFWVYKSRLSFKCDFSINAKLIMILRKVYLTAPSVFFFFFNNRINPLVFVYFS